MAINYFHTDTEIPLSQLSNLNEEELHYLLMSLRMKFKVDDYFSIKNQLTKAKSENKWKFIMKKAIKYLKQKLKKLGKITFKGIKIEDEKIFFHYYFRKICQEEFIPIERFYLPNSKLKKLSGFNEPIKTMKKSYIKLLCTSEKFHNDLIEFLNDIFIQEY